MARLVQAEQGPVDRTPLMTNEQVEAVKHVADGAAVLVAGATLAGVMPALAAVFTIIWTGIRIWETQTMRDFIAYIRGE